MIYRLLFEDSVARAVHQCIYEEYIPDEIAKIPVIEVECSEVDLASWVRSGKLKVRFLGMEGMDDET